jgi:hypothetical protein
MRTTTTPAMQERGGGPRLIAIAGLVVVVGLWLTFGVLLVANPHQLDTYWHTLRGIWLPLQALVWLLCLPWALALWVWQLAWPVAFRLLVIIGLGVATIFAFFPRQEQQPAA